MATKKEHKIVSASDGSEMTKEQVDKENKRIIKEAAPVGNATGYRVGAIILWVLALGFEVLAILVLAGKVDLKFVSTMVQLIGFLVLDLACVIIGSQLWKKANHIKPASEKNKLKFWLWNNMGVIVCAFCFIPFIILALTDKKADKKTKTIAVIAACVALAVGGLASADWHPVSAEQKAAAEQVLNGQYVYWTPFGHVYHTHEDCQALNQTDTLTTGDVEQAIAEGRTRLCAFCAKKDDIQGVATDSSVEEIAETVEEVVEEETPAA